MIRALIVIVWLFSVGCFKAKGRVASLWVSSFGSSEEENVRFRSVNFVVRPASALLHAKRAPLRFVHDAIARHFLKSVLGQNHMAVLVVVIHVLVAVLDFFRIVRHSSFLSFASSLVICAKSFAFFSYV